MGGEGYDEEDDADDDEEESGEEDASDDEEESGEEDASDDEEESGEEDANDDEEGVVLQQAALHCRGRSQLEDYLRQWQAAFPVKEGPVRQGEVECIRQRAALQAIPRSVRRGEEADDHDCNIVEQGLGACP
ncbi:hypothetical protein HPP92_000676 [Vanilla planifolia]|uniref:Uncharacterized protein n=1 Tax=Vanilla planifolia TaxID=51239 RepID=A0A835VH98_VANPL|nr:hypothetical protein HPP92_000676 [Vanilla planifolia]